MRPMTLRPADRVSQSQALLENLRTKRSTIPTSTSTKLTFAVQGNQGRAQEPRRILLAGKVPKGVRFGKTCCAATTESAACRTILSWCCCARCRARFWSWRRDSNPRPSDYKSDALPTELRQQLGKGAPPRKLIPLIPSRCPGQLYKVPQR